jgi:hypothetical protein
MFAVRPRTAFFTHAEARPGRETKSDVVTEWQRGHVLDGTGGQYLPYHICEFQRYRHAVVL